MARTSQPWKAIAGHAFCVGCAAAILWYSCLSLKVILWPDSAFAQVALRSSNPAEQVSFAKAAQGYGLILLHHQMALAVITIGAAIAAVMLLWVRNSARYLILFTILLGSALEHGLVWIAIFSST